MTEPLAALLRAGLLTPAEANTVDPLIARWTEDEAAEIECWAADYHLWHTDFVSFALGPAPTPLVTLLDTLGTGRLLDGYR